MTACEACWQQASAEALRGSGSTADRYQVALAANQYLGVVFIDRLGYAWCAACVGEEHRTACSQHAPHETLEAGARCDGCGQRFHGPAWWWEAGS